MIEKECKGRFWGAGNVLFLDLDDGYMTVFSL